MKHTKDYILLYFKGVAMGGADVIPGVSGGTVAFITGIYEELLRSIKSIDGIAFRHLRKFEIKALWQHINGSFLFTLLAGIFTSLFSLAKLMTHLLEMYPILIWSFFFGLILVSVPLILRDVKKWRANSIIAFIAGIGIAYAITILTPTETPNDLWFIFIAGALAICAMILPGISGAFILLLLGKYEYVIQALISLNIPVIAVFAIGCIVGILSFSRILTWILANYRYPALALLAGFMLGSLNKVWPWKEVVAFRVDSSGKQIPAFDKSIAPWEYLEKTGTDPQIFQAILMAALGIFIVVFVEQVAIRIKNKI